MKRIVTSFILAAAVLIPVCAEDSELQVRLPDDFEALGYEILTNDPEDDRIPRIMVTVTNRSQIVDLRARVTEGNEIEEWRVFFRDGSPLGAQIYSWKNAESDGEKFGEALFDVTTVSAGEEGLEFDSEETAKVFRTLLKLAKAELEES